MSGHLHDKKLNTHYSKDWMLPIDSYNQNIDRNLVPFTSKYSPELWDKRNFIRITGFNIIIHCWRGPVPATSPLYLLCFVLVNPYPLYFRCNNNDDFAKKCHELEKLPNDRV